MKFLLLYCLYASLILSYISINACGFYLKVKSCIDNLSALGMGHVSIETVDVL